MEAGGSVEMVTSVAELRKGAWSGDEDRLLRKCVETFGEGRWHLVPLRAGLNRCRKSCRLRWLNYLKPNIKRGEFSNDEIDLMARLHKLLGNRWALIAGRLPGRTANDVKNYWNTHQRKTSPHISSNIDARSMEITKTNIIKPRPWTFSSKGFVLPKKITTTEPRYPIVNSDVSKKRHHSSSDDDGGEISMWVDSLETLLDADEDVVGVNDNGRGKEIDVEDIGTSVDPMFDYDNQSFWSDIDIRHLIGDNNSHPQL